MIRKALAAIAASNAGQWQRTERDGAFVLVFLILVALDYLTQYL